MEWWEDESVIGSSRSKQQCCARNDATKELACVRRMFGLFHMEEGHLLMGTGETAGNGSPATGRYRSLTYRGDHHHPVIHLNLEHNPQPDVEAQTKTNQGDHESEKPGNYQIGALRLGVDVVGLRPSDHNFGGCGSHVAGEEFLADCTLRAARAVEETCGKLETDMGPNTDGHWRWNIWGRQGEDIYPSYRIPRGAPPPFSLPSAGESVKGNKPALASWSLLSAGNLEWNWELWGRG